MTLTVIAENGGFRELKTSTGHTQDYFYGQSSTKSSMFLFDFIKPYHCLQDKPYPCSSKALDVTEDITKVQCIAVLYMYKEIKLLINFITSISIKGYVISIHANI